ncbi:MAG: hypothetical protein AB1505_30630 [Candidatus Latescibacterota bacterium]
MHPHLQVRLLGYLERAAKEKDIQIIVTTWTDRRLRDGEPGHSAARRPARSPTWTPRRSMPTLEAWLTPTASQSHPRQAQSSPPARTATPLRSPRSGRAPRAGSPAAR